jgi:hypothetical protein
MRVTTVEEPSHGSEEWKYPAVATRMICATEGGGDSPAAMSIAWTTAGSVPTAVGLSSPSITSGDATCVVSRPAGHAFAALFVACHRSALSKFISTPRRATFASAGACHELPWCGSSVAIAVDSGRAEINAVLETLLFGAASALDGRRLIELRRFSRRLIAARCS